MLAGFNLLPAFPLDGGRVLRALLERRRSRVAATRLAARISRAIAVAMIGVGLLANVWLIVIGLFVVMAGGAEEAAVLIHAALGTTGAAALAVPWPVVLGAELPAGDAAHLAEHSPQPGYPVADSAGRYLGSVTAAVLHDALPTTPVGRLARGATVGPNTCLEEVADLIGTGPVAVSSDGRIIGFISAEDLNHRLRQRIEELPR